jgi:hypothetical protein
VAALPGQGGTAPLSFAPLNFFGELRHGEVVRRIYLPRDLVNKLVDLAQPSGLDLVDESAHALLVRDERARLDASDRLTHVLLQV